MNKVITAAKIGFLLVVALGVPACAQKPTTLVKYEKNGISFSYLSDWKVASDPVAEPRDGTLIIMLEGPREAIVSMTVVPASSQMTLDEYAGEIARSRQDSITQSLSVGAISPATVTSTLSQDTTAQVGGVVRKAITQTFSVALLGEKMPHRATFHMVADQDRKAYIQTQASVEDLARVTPGFEATLASFRMNTPR